MKYRVWYEPYGFAGEEDFMDVEAESEPEAVRFVRAFGYTHEVEILK